MTHRWTEDDLGNYMAKKAVQQNRAQYSAQPSERTPEVSIGNAYSFTVFGEPQPAGSKQAFPLLERPRRICRCGLIPGPAPLRRGNGAIIVNVTDDNKDTKAWRNHVSKTAREEYSGPLLSDYVSVECIFYLPRPKSHYGTGANADRVKPSAPPMPGVKPDLDKLMRAVGDGLTQAGNVYTDDSRIVRQRLEKFYGTPRVEITIAEIIASEPYEQPALFEPLPPWEREVSAGARQKAFDGRPGLVSGAIDLKDTCDGGTDHSDRSGEPIEPAPWEAQPETAAKKVKKSRGKVIA